MHALAQAWPPFVLVAGLLLIGTVVEADGLFAAIGARIERIGGGPVVLLATLLGLEALVTAVLNLDTAVAFLTPIILHAAQRRNCDERPFLYGALFMANGASLLLPGSNLTNLIVLAHEPLSGAEVAHALALPWLVVVVLTIGFLAVAFPLRREAGTPGPLPPLRLGLGLVATAAATVLILALHNAALPVLAVGIAASRCVGSARGSTFAYSEDCFCWLSPSARSRDVGTARPRFSVTSAARAMGRSAPSRACSSTTSPLPHSCRRRSRPIRCRC